MAIVLPMATRTTRKRFVRAIATSILGERWSQPYQERKAKVNIIRTQIYLRKDQHHELRDQAHEMGIPFTELLRRALDEYLHQAKGKSSAKPKGLAAITGLGRSDVTDGALNHDKYIADAIAERLEKRDIR